MIQVEFKSMGRYKFFIVMAYFGIISCVWLAAFTLAVIVGFL